MTFDCVVHRPLALLKNASEAEEDRLVTTGAGTGIPEWLRKSALRM